MASYPTVNLNHLFDGCKNLERVDGLANLSGTRAMAYAFRGCAVTSIDLRGFSPPSCLVDLDCTFSGRGSLTTIHVDPTWGLPSSGVRGSGTFGGCYALVGGNGTAWSSSNVGYEYMRVDKPGQPGYLTAG